jgi:uncharacterized membrane protein YqjE
MDNENLNQVQEGLKSENKSNTFSIISFVVSSLSLLMFPPFLGVISIIASVIGIFKEEKHAKIALVVAIVFMLLGMFFGLFFSIIFNS